jgi:hypothetical protein
MYYDSGVRAGLSSAPLWQRRRRPEDSGAEASIRASTAINRRAQSRWLLSLADGTLDVSVTQRSIHGKHRRERVGIDATCVVPCRR